MAYVYASLLGTTVLRHMVVPQRPQRFDGRVRVYGVPEAVTEATMRSALEAHGEVLECARVEAGVWAAAYATHEQALAARAAAAPVGAAAIDTEYNARPYDERGWTTFESAVATEGLARASFMPKVHTELARLPPKLVDIGGGGAPQAVAIEAAAGGAGPRIEGVIAALGAATFTGKGDHAVVVGLYREFIARIGNAFVDTGVAVDGEYAGEYNAAGQREGRGTYTFANGNVYEGEWKAGKKEGRGTYTYADGAVYEGEYKAGEMEGRGTYTYADGRAETGRYAAGADVGEGARWSADRQQAWRLRDGQPVESISLAEAARIAAALGLPVPPAHQ
jgi:hypothetical protein